MSWLLKGSLCLTVILISHLQAVATPQTRSNSDVDQALKVTVLFFDFVSLPENIQIKAQARVTEIYNTAGIELKWAPCSTGEGQLERYPGCNGFKDSTHVFLHVLPHARKGMKGEAGGEAILGARIINVFWDLAQSEAQRNAVPLPDMMGLIIAHEIGHLLLGPDSHSAAGIMTARWKSRDLIAICQGGWTFTRQECGRIQAEVKKRQVQQALVASTSAPME